MTSLSGGNQQKCSVAKWLEINPKVVILDEPTRGIDVGSKAEMYRLIGTLAASGLAVIVVSSEMPELIGLAHRVVVFREGKIVGELVGNEITETGIMSFAAGVKSEVSICPSHINTLFQEEAWGRPAIDVAPFPPGWQGQGLPIVRMVPIASNEGGVNDS